MESVEEFVEFDHDVFIMQIVYKSGAIIYLPCAGFEISTRETFSVLHINGYKKFLRLGADDISAVFQQKCFPANTKIPKWEMEC